MTYNHEWTQSATSHTLVQAKEKKQLNVHVQMKLICHHNRKFPSTKINDRVKIYKKSQTGETQQVSVWSDNTYKVVGTMISWTRRLQPERVGEIHVRFKI